MTKSLKVHPSVVKSAAEHCGLQDDIALDIINMVINLRTNAEILEHLQKEYGLKGKGYTVIRSINPLIKSFILHNYAEDFKIFCSANSIIMFNDDLESHKKHSSHARMMCVIFLRDIILNGEK